MLTVSEHKKSGLIICKEYHAEFAGPGAAIALSVEESYDAILAIGEPELVEVVTPEERQRAFSRRIQWLRWLQRIAEYPQSAQRAEKLLSGFAAFFGSQAAVDLPDDLLAVMVGVLPGTIATAKLQYSQIQQEKKLAVEGMLRDHTETAALKLQDYWTCSRATPRALHPLPFSA